jgi:site-specific DNA-methyltransferase (adenine-specific)/adenine-specific DNA-methyltransferase
MNVADRRLGLRPDNGPADILSAKREESGQDARADADGPEAHPPGRRFILVEMEPAIAKTITAERVKRVAAGYTNAKGEAVAGLGGGFRYCQLGEPLFDEAGQIRPTVKFGELARHVWFTETGEPLPRERVMNTPLLGVHRGTAIYLLYNGILGDKSAQGGNVLTRAILAELPAFDGPKVIFAAACLLGPDRLSAYQITVRQTPKQIRTA